MIFFYPGVSIANTSMLLAELPETGSISRGQIAKLVGVAPLANDSGLKEGLAKHLRRPQYGP
ncbi:MAG: hypothetical protein Aurels2KO_51810 [Aureliella sp.]